MTARFTLPFFQGGNYFLASVDHVSNGCLNFRIRKRGKAAFGRHLTVPVNGMPGQGVLVLFQALFPVRSAIASWRPVRTFTMAGETICGKYCFSQRQIMLCRRLVVRGFNVCSRSWLCAGSEQNNCVKNRY
jgi:hypothetical protein